jgi:hypothetical protein
MLNDLNGCIAQLRRQRLEPFQKLADLLLKHLDGILNYCRMKVRMDVVEAVNGNIKTVLRRGRGYTKSTLSVAQSAARGGDTHRICRFQESRVNVASCRILAESRSIDFRAARLASSLTS